MILQAGTPCAITIATNMAGRGTDIILGGDAKQSVVADFLSEWLQYLKPEAVPGAASMSSPLQASTDANDEGSIF